MVKTIIEAASIVGALLYPAGLLLQFFPRRSPRIKAPLHLRLLCLCPMRELDAYATTIQVASVVALAVWGLHRVNLVSSTLAQWALWAEVAGFLLVIIILPPAKR